MLFGSNAWNMFEGPEHVFGFEHSEHVRKPLQQSWRCGLGAPKNMFWMFKAKNLFWVFADVLGVRTPSNKVGTNVSIPVK